MRGKSSLRDADAIIAHSQLDFTVALSGAQPNLAVIARIFHGVIEQIVKGFLKPRAINVNRRQVRRNIDNHVEAVCLRVSFPNREPFPGRNSTDRRPQLQMRIGRFQLRESKQILDQQVEAL